MSFSVQIIEKFGIKFELIRIDGRYVVRNPKNDKTTTAKLDVTQRYYITDFGSELVSEFEGPTDLANWLIEKWTEQQVEILEAQANLRYLSLMQ